MDKPAELEGIPAASAPGGDILASLTEAQRLAVCHEEGPLLILAGPGSGKTRVVTHRIARLLERGVPDRSILALTFTNKAAAEMRERLERLAEGNRVWCGTFHRFCVQLLRRHASLVGLGDNFTIYDADDSRALLRDTIRQTGLDLHKSTPRQMTMAISRAKNDLLLPTDMSADMSADPLLTQLYAAYQRQLLAANAVDFDDLLLYTAALLRDNPELRSQLDARYQYVMVDEYQDTNRAQYAIVRALSIDQPNLAVTGDPDQSIYSWRGANVENILGFEHDYPQARVVRLEQNYRSSPDILRVADQVIAHNRQRRRKSMHTDNPPGDPVRLASYPDERAEATDIAAQIAQTIASGRQRPSDFAIFYRINSLSRPVEVALQSAGIPYQVIRGVEFFQRQEVKDILAYLQLMANPRDQVALLRVINVPPRRIGPTSIRRLTDTGHTNRIDLLQLTTDPQFLAELRKPAAAALLGFGQLVQRLSSLAVHSIEALLEEVLTETKYREYLKESFENSPARLDNLEELIGAARQFDQAHPDTGNLQAFLERTALVNDTDNWDRSADRVTLMTLHAAKGLEFPHVFVIGVEEQILPLGRNREGKELEEERRLLFVGMTRAQRQLQLSYACRRGAQRSYTVPSSFLMHLSRDELQIISHGGDPASPRQPAELWDTDWSADELPEDLEDRVTIRSRQADGIQENTNREPPGPIIKTAAALWGEPGGADATGSTPLPPEDYRLGMTVLHPEYGPGKIVALDGPAHRRTAKVHFVAGLRPQSFVLALSSLRPVP